MTTQVSHAATAAGFVTHATGTAQIRDGTSNTLLAGETNYSNQAWLWTGCPGLNGTQKYGEHAWAEGYWALSWGHMAGETPDAYNNSTRYRSPESRRAFRSDHPGGVQFVFLDG